MAFDKSLPPGNTRISLGDNSIRDNNEGVEDAFGGTVGDGSDLSGSSPRSGEHRFVTGGNQSGRHVFKHGAVAEQNGLSVSSEDDGWVIMRTDVRTGRRCWFVYDGSNWAAIDVGTGDIPRIDENSQFTAAQEFEWQSVVPAAGTLTLDFATQPSKYATVPASALMTIANPSNPPDAGFGSTYYLQLTNAGTGASLAWGSNYVSANGLTPAFNAASGAINFYVLSVLQTGSILVHASPAVGAF